jgi:hypothetical protein
MYRVGHIRVLLLQLRPERQILWTAPWRNLLDDDHRRLAAAARSL